LFFRKTLAKFSIFTSSASKWNFRTFQIQHNDNWEFTTFRDLWAAAPERIWKCGTSGTKDRKIF